MSPSEIPPPTDASRRHSPDEVVQMTRKFMDALPHAKALRLDVRSIGDGKAEFVLPFSEELVGDPDTGVLHGGAVSTLLDSTCGAAVMCHPESAGGTATLDLRIDYMRAATTAQDLVARAECYHVTRSVAFVRAVALDDDTENPVASATGAFTFTPKT